VIQRHDERKGSVAGSRYGYGFGKEGVKAYTLARSSRDKNKKRESRKRTISGHMAGGDYGGS
jgi:hypothetical protein